MAEALILSAATGAAKGILDGLLSLAKDQIEGQVKLAFGFMEDLEKLCKKLEIIRALLHDADDHKITLQTMLVWLQHLKAATSEAENVLDELAYEARRREVQNRIGNKVRDMFTLSNPLFFRFKMANKVSNINKLLKEICDEANEFGLKPAGQLEGPVVQPREFKLTHPFVDDLQVVGREGDVSAVVDMLLRSNLGVDLSVTAIVGMAGLGKTTLAQLVYKEAKVLKNFGEERIWICVSVNFNVETLLNEMVQSLLGDKSKITNIEGAVRMLREKLNEKKYLLVLDDVWNTDSNLWVSFRNALLGIGGSKGSKILVTTRNMEVLSAMHTLPSCTHTLAKLSDAYCWKMLKKRAFAIGGPRATPTLLEIGRRLVAKCKGVPLAINSLGGLLYLKQDEGEWKSIENSEIWSLLDHKNEILPVLRLSFDQLPSPSLKQCFSYCSIFPKDKVIVKDELIQLWMSLGYLRSQSKSQGEMEELGNEYFKILWHNSLFQEVEFDDYNNITTCKMHDLVHDLALHVSQGNCLISEASEVKYNPDVQHLSLFFTTESRIDISKEKVGKVRTLFVEGHQPQNTHDFKCLRAFRLEENISSIEELPSSIRKSIHLRFLDLAKTSILKIPNHITKLYNLETLKLPRSPNELPKDFHKLVSLRHFYIENSVENRKLMPMNIGQLTSLQTLPFFVVGEKSGHRIEELGSLSKLRGTLWIYGLEHVKDEDAAKKAKVIEKPGIQELRLEWDEESDDEGVLEAPEVSNNNHESVLEGLEPHQNVKALKLVNFGGRRLASWMSRDARSLQNVVKIKLMNCRLCEQLPALGHLPHLAYLEMVGLRRLKSIGPDFYGAASTGIFPALIYFKLQQMPQLEEWLMASPTAAMSTMKFFPRLQELYIKSCPKLITLPEGVLQPNLGSLILSHCRKLEQLPALGRLPHLEHLEMRGLHSLKSIGPEFYGAAAIGEFPALINFELDDMPQLEEWLDVLSSPTAAVSTMKFFPQLQEFCIHNCPNLKTLPAFKDSTSFRQLDIRDCSELTCLPEGLLQPNLEVLWLISCPKLETPKNPDALRSLTSLNYLTIRGCPNWGSCWEEGLFCTTSLKTLYIGEFGEEYRYFPWPSTSSSTAASPPCSHFTSLEYLNLYGWPEVKSLPDQLDHLPALRQLDIWNFSGLESLPECLANLKFINIIACPLLKKRCEKEIGEDWHKIAHIPYIEIGGRRIQWAEV